MNRVLLRSSVLLGCLILLCAAWPAWAETHVSTDIQPKSGTVSDVFTLSVSVSSERADSIGEPEFPDSKEFSIEKGSTSTRQSLTFGLSSSQSFTLTYNFRVYPNSNLAPGEYRLPAGEMTIAGKRYRLKQVKLRILAPGQVPRGAEKEVDFTQIVDNNTPYVGEQVLYRAEIASPYNVSGKLSDIDWTGFWQESFGEHGKRERNVGDVHISSVLEALFPLSEGKLEIPERMLAAEVSIPRSGPNWGSSGLDHLIPDLWRFQSPRVIPRRLTAPSLSLDVKPLPQSPWQTTQPVAVGKVKLRTEIDKTRAKQGESISVKITISGDANLRPLKLPEPEGTNVRDFRIYYDEPEIQTYARGDRIVFEKIFRIAFIPLRAGTLQLPKFTVVYFDPTEKSYHKLASTQRLLEVVADANVDKLVVAAPDGKAEALESEVRKKDVTQLAEDLLPQRVGSELFGSSTALSSTAAALVLIIVPLAAIILRLLVVQMHTLHSDPSLIRQKKALERAKLSVNQLLREPEGFSLDQIHQVVLSYLGDRFRVQGESLTAKDAGRLLRAKIKHCQIGDTLEDYLAALERQRFSPDYSSKHASTSDADKALKLVEEIENAL